MNEPLIEFRDVDFAYGHPPSVPSTCSKTTCGAGVSPAHAAETAAPQKRGVHVGQVLRTGASITVVGRIGNPSNCRTDCQSVLRPSPTLIEAPVLSGCNFSLRPGQRVTLLGPNGCGKTTLLHLMVGLLRPTAGQIEVFGQPRVTEADFHEVRRRVGLLFQDADDQLFCPTVAEDVAFGPLNLGKSRDEVRCIVASTLDSLGLAGYEHRVTYRLSGGEKRLVALATVLAMQPEVLLFDEPSGGLDDASTERLIGVLARLPQAMIVVSHDRPFWEAVTTSRVELKEGRMV